VSWDPRGAIEAKRDGHAVDEEQLRRLIDGYTAGSVGDGPMAAFLMACLVRGLDLEETAAMTRVLLASGSRLTLEGIGRPLVDKHSTGGVSDGVSLVFVPLVAALGLACVKLSGRALGHTGGTIDKLEAIPGLRVDRSAEEIRAQAAAIGCVIAAPSASLVPADRAIYALRDATATVPSIPLIAASVMAKKLVIDADLIVLDVKVGSGAFLRELDDAVALAGRCLALAREADRAAVAAVTDMSQPLGDAIGNALEVAEAIRILHGSGRNRVRDLAVALGARAAATLLELDIDAATQDAAAALDDGRALASFRALVTAQGGDPRVVDDPAAVLAVAPVRRPLRAARTGTLRGTDAAALGEAARSLGAGRRHPGDRIDPAVGIVLTPKVGDPLQEGQLIGEVHARDEAAADAAADTVTAAMEIGDGPALPPPLVHRWLEEVS
jgi:pyrimidine-nucleoside phosphorylase